MTPVTRPPWLVMQAAAAGMIPGASGRQVTLAPGRMAVGASPNTRLVIEGIVFILRTGCQWKALPLNVTEVQEAVLDAIEIERANPPRRRRKHLYADVGYTGAPALKVIKDGYIPGCQGTRTRGCRTQTLSQEESQAPGG
ncbi:transposase [Rhodoferax ferrireducens]|uniref:transposase n=1 Tax=Rhodoferax ferrireducens TaxID=192843 RepID=UPI003BB60885